MTTEQVRNKTKTVTRRFGWWFLVPGQRLRAVEKSRGLKKGEKVKSICQIEVVSVHKEQVKDICFKKNDIKREGFPGMCLYDFMTMLCKLGHCDPDCDVNRIEFKYI